MRSAFISCALLLAAALPASAGQAELHKILVDVEEEAQPVREVAHELRAAQARELGQLEVDRLHATRLVRA